MSPSNSLDYIESKLWSILHLIRRTGSNYDTKYLCLFLSELDYLEPVLLCGNFYTSSPYYFLQKSLFSSSEVELWLNEIMCY